MAGRYKFVIPHPSSERSQNLAKEADRQHKKRATTLRPRGLAADEKKIWDRLAPELSKLGRLAPHYVDVIYQFCVVTARMERFRAELDAEGWIYETTGRHGDQRKSKPEAAQINDDFRKWSTLVAQLGLSPGTCLRFGDKEGASGPGEFDGL